MVDLGNRLKTLRLQKGITQENLAAQLSVTKSTISAYENGDRRPPLENLLLLARIFKVTTDYLLGVEQKSDTCIDISGLTDVQKSAVKSLIKTMRG